MSETVNQELKVENTAAEPERTFTQAELDAIISDRLKREREKYADFDTLKEKAAKYDAAVESEKTELQKATERADKYKEQLDAMQKAEEVRKIRDKVAQEKGIPVNLLTGETEEACTAQADALLAWNNPDKPYPAVRDSGEVRKVSGGENRDKFKNWFNDNFS